MPENEILAEIHRVREDIARECHYDVNELFARLRRTQAKAEADGWKIVGRPQAQRRRSVAR